jgi:metal-responsive CopG/Arc/MetJ family transcriptional regulator
MAKVMVSLPDALLRQLDAEATRRGTTRSGLLRALAEEEFRRADVRRAERIKEINREGASNHGGNVAEVLKRNRPR